MSVHLARDAEAFLLAFHRGQPGVTSRAFAHGRVAGRGSSYEMLADQVGEGSGRILDLACGDGHLLEVLRRRGVPAARLVGLDMSADELELARARPALEGALLVRERAQALPFADASFDCVVSHMALMLMSDVDAVVSELARVLAPGGLLAAVLGGGPRAGSTFELFLDLFLEAYRGQPERIPALGDRRMRRDAGVAEIVGPHSGFAPPEIRDAYVELDGSRETVCESLMTIYESAALSEREREAVREAFTARARARLRADGTLPCEMAIRLVLARRR
jgi:SAM-dependent methyltransferase